MYGVGMLHFLKDLWKFIQIHQYHTMALTLCSPTSTFGTDNGAMQNELIVLHL